VPSIAKRLPSRTEEKVPLKHAASERVRRAQGINRVDVAFAYNLSGDGVLRLG
jgi:hypothetical protein